MKEDWKDLLICVLILVIVVVVTEFWSGFIWLSFGFCLPSAVIHFKGNRK